MLAYNHEKFIARAIESVLEQKTDFDYELIIGDDHSADSTQAKIKAYAKRNSGIIIPVLRDKNIGPNFNYTDLHSRAQSKYIALLEGDDYWTDPYKLQKQVDFLERNPDYVISFTDYSHLEQDSDKLVTHTDLHPSDTLTIEDLVKNNYISTLTCVFRNHLFDGFPEDYFKLRVGDWPLHVLNARYGKARYHRGWITGVYRMHGQGVWSNQSGITKYTAYADVNVFFKRHLEKKYQKIINKNIRHYYYAAAVRCLKANDLSTAGQLLERMAEHAGKCNPEYLKIILKYYWSYGHNRF